MKKITCALVAAASLSAVMATIVESPAESPAVGQMVNNGNAALPAIGTMVGASLLSFFAFYIQ